MVAMVAPSKAWSARASLACAASSSVQKSPSAVEPLQLPPHPQAELVGRLLGEGHDEDAVDGYIGRQDELHHEMLERERLARPRRRLEHRVAVEGHPAKHRRPDDATRAQGFTGFGRRSTPKRASIIARAAPSSGMG
jgi:hypothetical protein